VNEKAAAAGGFNAMTVGIHLRTGKPVREIVQLATELSADLTSRTA
jgi:nucleotide-binding universal stress UspA family protein